MNRLALVPLALGRYPTPVERISGLSSAEPERELWVKRDDQTHDVCGGNKVRKLEWLLADARARGARRLITIGAAGSHHVLTTTYFGRREGLDVEAVLVPQPRTEHVVEVLRASIGLGLRAVPARSWTRGALTFALRMMTARTQSRIIPLGGSSVNGSMGYVVAARELAAQVRAGALPEPDLCIVALGSGGTAAGLAAGFAAERMKTRVVGVCVSKPAWALRLHATMLARACARRAADRPLRLRLTTDSRFLGAGYGHPTRESDEATRLARETAGLELDPTYTAKAFAASLWYLARGEAQRTILYWHTLGNYLGNYLGNDAHSTDSAKQTEELDQLGRLLLPTSGVGARNGTDGAEP
jgi:1-aminocyclopropane-1-carboxylate deaminase/D-cysteine desulfhydrase-like pyridoxal-dependent ACC family enzyme